MNLLQHCHLAICPASSISLESCAVGIPILTGYTADNQKGNYNGLLKNGCALDLGNMNTISKQTIIVQIQSLILHPENCKAMLEAQRKFIDGKSPERILNVFKALDIIPKLHFRFANMNDIELYYNWANDKLVRENSYNQNSISLDEHTKWFQSKLNQRLRQSSREPVRNMHPQPHQM